MIVHSGGLDEIRLDQNTHVVELRAGDISEYELDPKQFDIQSTGDDAQKDLSATSIEDSLRLVREALTKPDTPAADIVTLNAGAAIYVSGVATSLENGVLMAADAIASGLAKERLDELTRVSKMMGQA